MALIPPFYMDCVVSIGALDETSGDARWIASGFLYGHPLDPPEPAGKSRRYAVYLVSNRHVFADLARAILRFNPQAKKPAREYVLDLQQDGRPLWVGHAYPDVDVAVAPVNFHLLKKHAMQVAFFEGDAHALDLAGMRRQGVTEGDFAYVLGFPMGLVGGPRNAVIVRSGTIARIRDTLGRRGRDFLIDTFVFPGNSGGPVVLKPEATSIRGTPAHPDSRLIGIVSGYVPYQDVAVSVQTQHPRIIFEENSGLASAYPIDFVERAIRQHLESVKPRHVYHRRAR